ncbi:hypothetical protein HAX54_022179 [Datura stramonium]|uniref:Uncharacterized protein n=1 Tax=Datura stramonium TaxID=4076 RepID=A0ABS8UWC9_DATST|nr:hypothetical protein [Datura stramonium]
MPAKPSYCSEQYRCRVGIPVVVRPQQRSTYNYSVAQSKLRPVLVVKLGSEREIFDKSISSANDAYQYVWYTDTILLRLFRCRLWQVRNFMTDVAYSASASAFLHG